MERKTKRINLQDNLLKKPRLAALIVSLAIILCLCSALALGGCSASSNDANASSTNNGTSQQTASTSSAAQKITIGTLATEDILPCWVAEKENLYAEEGLDANVVVFMSASELIAAVSSGSVDFAMTDPMVCASLYASGANVQIRWVTLGADASQGRFGILTADPSVQSLTDLAGVPVGVGSNTILEYVMDKLFERAGVPADQVVKEEVQKLPVRYQAVASGTIAAAALPASLLALGEASGCTVVADDTTGENISQSVMISCKQDTATDSATSDSAEENSVPGDATTQALARVWNKACARINASPETYRALLAQKASLPESIASTYEMSTYPYAALPEQSMIDSVLTWMKAKNYIGENITYDAQTGCFLGR